MSGNTKRLVRLDNAARSALSEPLRDYLAALEYVAEAALVAVRWPPHFDKGSPGATAHGDLRRAVACLPTTKRKRTRALSTTSVSDD